MEGLLPAAGRQVISPIRPSWQLSAPRERLGALVVPLAGGHSPMLSQPEAPTEILLRAAP